MIVDARVFRPEFVPGDIIHRDEEVNALAAALDPITRGEQPDPALLFGPSGTGKTCIARHTLAKLREAVIDLDTQYVNCWEDYTRFKTLHRLLEGVDRGFDVHRQSTPRDELLERLRDHDGPYVAVLDEVDQHEDKHLLYDLYRVRDLSLVLVANRERDLLAGLDERLTSRLHTATRIRFDRYSDAQLVSILGKRVQAGLREDAITRDQLEMIAEAAAGDARVAIGTLRVAAREASRLGLGEITDAVVEDAVPEAKSEIKRSRLDRLNPDQRVLYDIVHECGQISPGDLYDKYCERADDPKTKRMVRNYLRKLCRYDLIIAEGENRGRTYRPA